MKRRKEAWAVVDGNGKVLQWQNLEVFRTNQEANKARRAWNRNGQDARVVRIVITYEA